MKKIITVAGARPNFMKIAPIYKAFSKHTDKVKHMICHTGQHYDKKMSDVFFRQLELPEPEFNLGIGSGSHAVQTAGILVEFEKLLISERPDLIIVVGDVNSTIACTLAAAKLGIRTAHVESGLRSFDRAMPEEINRLLTDSISDMLFVTEPSGLQNLKNEGVPAEKIFFTGNVMIDSLAGFLDRAENTTIMDELKLKAGEYILVTMHRPSNTDNPEQLRAIVEMIENLAGFKEVVFPVHPRTKSAMEKLDKSLKQNNRIKLIEPLGYLDFLKLMKYCDLVVTDSGGIQEETTYLGVQCVTLRKSTERPVTVDVGTNHLAGDSTKTALEIVSQIYKGNKKTGRIPELWDGKAAERIVEVILKSFE
ncbi:MAG: UDP-N-acetylglucosamine 2-epimerase (non-hydrolyzing) [Ignavibacteriales bacterium]|nr:UDP-N-acetylglucosamine 2-epimerase (non-hydrolyzing) [Ignavibacteriales bacterium]MCF8314534.1 UDP-N-acetylglucosamine 2-epimerase (non-hydrolyzing) [Ignavibacteriales bacterium]MCF8436429.1 UDP-N-acetylglucosamine 2-epimerase (non-hydrolyzing) [Ignavibacteriales bacterium]